jgi:hypothetical protein
MEGASAAVIKDPAFIEAYFGGGVGGVTAP